MEFFILKDGEVLESAQMEWAVWFNDINNRRIAWDETQYGTVSTVFIGCGHQLFETLVTGGVFDGCEKRWTTFAEAKREHLNMLHRVIRAGKKREARAEKKQTKSPRRWISRTNVAESRASLIGD